MRLFSLEGKTTALLGAAATASAVLSAALGAWLGVAWLGAAFALLIVFPLLAFAARQITAPLQSLLRALSGSVASMRDGDFSVSLREQRSDEFGELIRAHNELGSVLRDERQNQFLCV